MAKPERDLAHRKNRRIAGVCGRNGCTAPAPETYLCDECREAMRLYMRDYRRRKREEARAAAAA